MPLGIALRIACLRTGADIEEAAARLVLVFATRSFGQPVLIGVAQLGQRAEELFAVLSISRLDRARRVFACVLVHGVEPRLPGDIVRQRRIGMIRHRVHRHRPAIDGGALIKSPAGAGR